MNEQLSVEKIKTDVLIVGGGTAGCYAAYTLAQNSRLSVLIAEKANIRRSGCLAAGVNAINAYITDGQRPEDYVDYAKKDAKGIVREDLLLSMCRGLNEVTKKLEENGLVILKDDRGKYVTRGKWNIKINGENIKPILAKMAVSAKQVSVLNHVNVTDFLVWKNRIYGAVGFHVNERRAVVIYAGAVLISTGGAAGLYRPNNPGFSRHKMWYPPFNTGAGYAMGIKAGAEMTTFEMRFIALRCKDTIAPTGTIAQGVHAGQINSYGENYESAYGNATCERVYGTTMENLQGRGPCYLQTDFITEKQEEDLYKAYLNMAPSQTLKWIESGKGPSKENVEIEGTEPYIVGGHTASGYWVDSNRQTTIRGLYAAGDVAGGAPQKYVTGALAEGKIAAESIIRTIFSFEVESSAENPADSSAEDSIGHLPEDSAGHPAEDTGRHTAGEFAGNKEEQTLENISQSCLQEYEKHLYNTASVLTVEMIEEALQKVMDCYAGGIGRNYSFNEHSLEIARKEVKRLLLLAEGLAAKTMDDLLSIYEIKERIILSLSLVEHLKARKETRWHGFSENMDYPEMNKNFEKYVNSCFRRGEIRMIYRKLITCDQEPLIFEYGEDNSLIYGGDFA